MAFITKTAFEPRIVKNRTNDLCNVAGKFYSSSAVADCSAGMLVKRNELLDCEGFSGVKNENAWKMVVAESTDLANEVIYACNTYEPKRIDQYYIGHDTLGLGVHAGDMGNFTIVEFDGQSVYRFGEGNIDGTIGTKTIFTIDDGLLKPESAAPTTTGAIYFELRGTGKFVEGNRESFTYYDVVGKKVVAVAE